MKIKFKKFEPTSTFLKLFGSKKDKSGAGPNTERERDTDYEYYYKRNNTYYFRNSDGNKVSINYSEPQSKLIRGNRYQIDAINNSSR